MFEDDFRRHMIELLRDIRDDGRKIHAALESLGALTSLNGKRMSVDSERANTALDKIAADNATMRDLLTQLAAAASHPDVDADMKTLADKAETVAASSDAAITQAQASIPVVTPSTAS